MQMTDPRATWTPCGSSLVEDEVWVKVNKYHSYPQMYSFLCVKRIIKLLKSYVFRRRLILFDFMYETESDNMS